MNILWAPKLALPTTQGRGGGYSKITSIESGDHGFNWQM